MRTFLDTLYLLQMILILVKSTLSVADTCFSQVLVSMQIFPKVWKSLEFYSLTQKPCFSLFPHRCHFSLFTPLLNTHTQFCYQLKAQREVSEGAFSVRQVVTQMMTNWRPLHDRLPIKSRPGFHASTAPVNGDQRRSGKVPQLSHTVCVSAIET